MLAATLSANYGIYGPAFELGEQHAARAGQRGVPRLGEVRAADWDLERPGHACATLITRVNRDPPRAPGAAAQRAAAVPRDRQRPAARLQQEQRRIGRDVILCVVNLDSATRPGRACSSSTWTRSGSPATAVRGATTCSTARASRWQRARALRRSIRSIRAPDLRVRARPLAETPVTATEPPARRHDPGSRRGRRAATRSGTRTRSSTSCTSARSSTATATASATSRA